MSYNFLLLRGLSREEGHWGEFKDRLKRLRKVKSVHPVNLPGNGSYHKLSSPFSVGQMAEFVRSHDPIGDSQKKIVFAYSLGAMVAIELFNRYPQYYSGGILINTSVSDLSNPLQRIKPTALKHFVDILRSKEASDRESAILDMVSNSPEAKQKVLSEWVTLSGQRRTSLFNSLRQLVAAGIYRLPEERPPLPLKLLTSEGDRMVDSQCSKNIASEWNLPIETHPSAGHEITLDDPEWVLTSVRNWLNELDKLERVHEGKG